MSATPAGEAPIHSWLVRLTHWINAVSIVVMIGSGLQIHNAHPIAPFAFPAWMTIGGWLGGALLWHFAAMWVFAINLVLMLGYGLASGRYRRKLWPIRPRELISDVRAALGGRLGHADLARYNAVQKALYAGVIAALVLALVSGLAIWKPVQFAGLADLMGGFQGGRIVHFLAMVAITLFLIVHVAMALIVPRSLLAMARGR